MRQVPSFKLNVHGYDWFEVRAMARRQPQVGCFVNMVLDVSLAQVAVNVSWPSSNTNAPRFVYKLTDGGELLELTRHIRYDNRVHANQFLEVRIEEGTTCARPRTVNTTVRLFF